jgi:hypothetical protein
MKQTSKEKLVNGIIVMSKPSILFGTVTLLVLLGWINMGELSTMLWICAAAYLILSLVGGIFARTLQERSAKDS